MNDELKAAKMRMPSTAAPTARPGAVLEGRAVISPAAPVEPDDSGDEYLYGTPLDPQGLNPVGSTALLGLAAASAAAWLIFGRKKKRTQGRRR